MMAVPFDYWVTSEQWNTWVGQLQCPLCHKPMTSYDIKLNLVNCTVLVRHAADIVPYNPCFVASTFYITGSAPIFPAGSGPDYVYQMPPDCLFYMDSSPEKQYPLLGIAKNYPYGYSLGAEESCTCPKSTCRAHMNAD